MRHGRWWIVESEGLREPEGIQLEHQKVVCRGGSKEKVRISGFLVDKASCD